VGIGIDLGGARARRTLLRNASIEIEGTSCYMSDWYSDWQPAYDAVVAQDPSPQVAVQMMLQFGARKGLRTPNYYVNTAISSAGWVDPGNFTREDLEKNNKTASLILGALASNDRSLVTTSSVMVPTELGKVPSWKDTDYLMFYFAWMAGLNSEGAERFCRSMDDPFYSSMKETANRRGVPNDQRWPSYRLITEVLISKLQMVESLDGIRAGESVNTLIQLVDVDKSLGCQAERIFADVLRLDIIAPTFEIDRLSGELAEYIEGIGRDRGAVVGATRTPVEVIAIALR
jgi:hypothetical protein